MLPLTRPRPTTRPNPSHIRYKIAESREERTAAFRLIYEKYLRSGLIDPNRYRLRVTPFHLLRTTNVFIAVSADEILCTVTLIGDGELGFPMERVYPDQVADARRRGMFLGEVSCLACRNMRPRQFLPIFVQLTRLMAQHARAYGMDQFLIATHPRHARFYQRLMGFRQIGGKREYPSVRNAPAVAFGLDFSEIDRKRPACYERYFGTPIPIGELRPRPMDPADVRWFRPMAAGVEPGVPILV